jgi:bifunctional enzyme CysN/CysC
VVAINKMDLVGLSQERFEEIRKQFEPLAAKLEGVNLTFIPVAAIAGDNVVRRSSRMPWYTGQSILEYLETVPVTEENANGPLRFPVQYVIRAEGGRGYGGQLVSGSVKVGDEVLALPSGRKAKVQRIPSFDGDLDQAFSPMSAAIWLDDHLDVSRGDTLTDPKNPPSATRAFRAKVVWMSETPLSKSRPYLVKHASQTVCANIIDVHSRLDIGKLSEEPTEDLKLNDIGIVSIETHRQIFCDPYKENRRTGSFVIIDPMSNLTVGAGMIESVMETRSITPHIGGHQGLTVWLTGLSSAGKSTLTQAIHERLWARGYRVEIIDGDEVRRYLSRGLGFSKEDRDENIRRIGFLAELLTRNGVIALVSAISPYRSIREEIKGRIPRFLEVFVNAPLNVCEGRDVKGLYRKARAGEIPSFTGIDDPYEAPLSPDVEVRTDLETVPESADKIIAAIEERIVMPKPA